MKPAAGGRALVSDMRKTAYIVLIVGFLAVDFFFFHDFFKPGEMISLPQYLTGFLSLIVFALALPALARQNAAS